MSHKIAKTSRKSASDQRKARIDRRKDHIKCGEQNNAADAVGQKANKRDANLCLVREMLRAVSTASRGTTSGSSNM